MGGLPYLAIRCLHQLAEENQNAHPRVSQTIREDFYMDDSLCGTRGRGTTFERQN